VTAGYGLLLKIIVVKFEEINLKFKKSSKKYKM